MIHALIDQQRRFVKPLRYDVGSAAAFPNALLTVVGQTPRPLHVVSALAPERERALKEQSISREVSPAWAWRTEQPMPPLPPEGD